MTQALKELLAKVEAGDIDAIPDATFSRAFRGQPLAGIGYNFEQSFLGSLDAAKALHEALLPGWDWLINSRSNYAHVWQKKEVGDWNVDAQSLHSPARAWLAAILKAKIAESA